MRRGDLLLVLSALVASCATTPVMPDGGSDASEPDVVDASPVDASDSSACADGVKDGLETDIDCGGPTCPACVDGKACVLASDCKSLDCSAGTCGIRAWSVESTGNDVSILGNQTWVDLAASGLEVNPNLYAQSMVFMRWTGTLRFAGGGNGGCHVGQRFVVDDAPTGDPTWGNAIMVMNGGTRWHEMFTTETAMPLAPGLHTIRVQMTDAGGGWGNCYLDGDGGATYDRSRLAVSAHDPTEAWFAESTGDTGALPPGTAFVAIPGVTVTMSLPATRHVQMALTGTQYSAGPTNSVSYCGYRLVIDSVPQGDATWGQEIELGDTALGWWAPVSLKFGQDLAAGEHTIAAQITSVSGGGGTCDAGQGNNPYARFRLFVTSTPSGGPNVSVESTGPSQLLNDNSGWMPVGGLSATFKLTAPTPVQLEMAGVEQIQNGPYEGQCAWRFDVDGAPLGDSGNGQAINVGSGATAWWTAMSLLYGATFPAGMHTVSVDVNDSSSSGMCGANGGAAPYGRARLLVRAP